MTGEIIGICFFTCEVMELKKATMPSARKKCVSFDFFMTRRSYQSCKYYAVVGVNFIQDFLLRLLSRTCPHPSSPDQLHGYSDGKALGVIAAAETFLTGIGDGKLAEEATVELAGQLVIAVADVASGEIK